MSYHASCVAARPRGSHSHPSRSRKGVLRASTSETLPLAETPAAGTHAVIIEFASVAKAEEHYDSLPYQRLLSERLEATRPVVAMIVRTDE